MGESHSQKNEDAVMKCMKMIENGEITVGQNVPYHKLSEIASRLPLDRSEAAVNLIAPSVDTIKEHIHKMAADILSPRLFGSAITAHIKASYTSDQITRTSDDGLKYAQLGTIFGLDETGLNPGLQAHVPSHGVDGRRDLAGYELDGRSRKVLNGMIAELHACSQLHDINKCIRRRTRAKTNLHRRGHTRENGRLHNHPQRSDHLLIKRRSGRLSFRSTPMGA